MALHVMPADDLIDHVADEDCVCGPRDVLRVDPRDGGDLWLCVHHSLDRRETREVS